MKRELIGLILVINLTCTSGIGAISQNVSENSKDWRTELEAINSTTEQLYITEDADALTNLYARQFTFFPEYKPAIFETKVLNKFFRDWFGAGDVRAYKKKIHTVEQYDDHFLEMGTFSLQCPSIKNSQGEYSGHYMVLWKRNNVGKLSIVSETFGAASYIEPEVVPYATVMVEKINFSGIDNVSKKLIAEVEAFDAIVLRAVATGDGNARANGFTDDAILLSAFDSIRVGIESIRPKMLKTYTTGVSFIVKHYYNTIVDLGDYVFVTGQYKGGWGDTTKGGRFEGNMCSLFKRKNGKLLAYRQSGNRDSGLILYDN